MEAAEPKCIRMTKWKNHCGTVGCFAGWVCIANGQAHLNPTCVQSMAINILLKPHMRLGGMALGSKAYWCVSGRLELMFMARDDVTSDADINYIPFNRTVHIDACYSNEDRKAIVLSAVKHFRATGESRWTKFMKAYSKKKETAWR